MSDSDKQLAKVAECQITEAKDENQITQEILGETALIEEYVYSFKQGGKQVTSLSYSGIKEMVRKRGNFQILKTEIQETEKTIRALVTIRDVTNRVEFLGASEADKSKPFAYTLAVNKAERNAYRKSMPAEFLAKMVDAFLHGKQDTQAPPTCAPVAEEKASDLPRETNREGTICPQCGGNKKAGFDVCYACHEAEKAY